MRKTLFLVATLAGGFAVPGCSGSEQSDDGLKGAPPPVIQPDPGMKAPEDRPGMKKDGGAAGAG